MKKIINKLKKLILYENKVSLTIYLVLRFLIIVCMVRELFNGNFQNALLCVLSLILFLIPAFVEKKFKIDLPTVLEVIIFIFIFSAEILGEINNFYGRFPLFDDILHTINGFLAASVGFSLVYLLNEKSESVNLSPVFISLVAFCFSMTIGVVWEFFEYGMDNIFNLDMQKDAYVYNINTVTIDPKHANNVIKIDDINNTIIYKQGGSELLKLDGYLDIGLHDTMKDLLVNFIGALIFSIFGYMYIINKEKYHLAGKFLTQKNLKE
ncbi:MAG: hypothetical protein E7165_04460 [Firmicutes bacterium]|nr:hypothetical protein [Bacillota bacterium]